MDKHLSELDLRLKFKFATGKHPIWPKDRWGSSYRCQAEHPIWPKDRWGSSYRCQAEHPDYRGNPKTIYARWLEETFIGKTSNYEVYPAAYSLKLEERILEMIKSGEINYVE